MENQKDTLYPSIDLSTWIKTGEGGNGSTYEDPTNPDVLLKVNKDGLNDLDSVMREFAPSAEVAKLGLSTPAMIRIVKVGDAYGILSERIRNKKSLFRICHDQPERTDEIAIKLAHLGKELFSTPCNTDFFPSRKQVALRGIEISTFLGKRNCEKLRSFVEKVPEVKTCVHGDFQGGNVITTGEKYYWIDLGRFAWGDPMFDIGHLYLSCMVYSRLKPTREIFHMEEDQLHRFWDVFAGEYTGKEDHREFDHEASRFAAVDIAMRQYYQKCSFIHKMFFRFQLNGLMKSF